MEELAVSIKNVGIIQPIVVCPTGDDTYVIVAGERRFRANKIAGNTTIPVIVKNYNEKTNKRNRFDRESSTSRPQSDRRGSSV